MYRKEEFEEGQVFTSVADNKEKFCVELDGFEGPADVLLSLARDQKVDVTQISILELANQYLEFIDRAEKLNLELAADYLVMAAWLAFLKSRLIIPELEDENQPTGPEMASALQYQLKRLESMQEMGQKLINSPQLGVDFFARGLPETFHVQTKMSYELSLYDLLRAYGAQRERKLGTQALKMKPFKTFSVEQAVNRLRGLIGSITGWRELWSFLPKGIKSKLLQKSAIASTFAACLELVKEGQSDVQQVKAFGPIHIRSCRGKAPS